MYSSKNWCFTLNNYTDNEFENLLGSLNYSYIIIGKEISESGTPHLQGYVEFANSKRFQTLKNFNERIHWEVRQGTQNQAIEYCKKENNVTERGTKKQQGQRTDLCKIRTQALENGMRMVTKIGNIQQIKVAEKFLEYNEPERAEKPRVIWIHGPSGVGKSRKALDLMEDNDYYRKNDPTKWWPGYDGHENIILDDFRPSWFHLTYLLGLIDRYSFRVETKGGYRQFLGKFIVITSIFSPLECYTNTGEDLTQLTRRLDEIIHLNSYVSDVAEVGEGNTETSPNSTNQNFTP